MNRDVKSGIRHGRGGLYARAFTQPPPLDPFVRIDLTVNILSTTRAVELATALLWAVADVDSEAIRSGRSEIARVVGFER